MSSVVATWASVRGGHARVRAQIGLILFEDSFGSMRNVDLTWHIASQHNAGIRTERSSQVALSGLERVVHL
jgi:hypothetical protein